MLPDQTHPRSRSRWGQLGSAVVVVFLFANFARCTNGGALLATKSPGAVHAQVHIEHQLVVEIQKPMLTVGFGSYSPVPVEQLGPFCEAALRRRHLQLLRYKDLLEVVSNPMNGVTFRH